MRSREIKKLPTIINERVIIKRKILVSAISLLIIATAWVSISLVRTNREHELKTQQLQSQIKALGEAKTKTEVEKQNIKKEKEELQKQYEQLKQSKANAVSVAYAAPVKVQVPQGDCLSWIQQAGITDVQSAYTLVMRESGCRVNAYNASSGATGIPQSLPGSKMASAGADWATNPITQLRWMKTYCESRYGSFAGALAHSNQFGWY